MFAPAHTKRKFVQNDGRNDHLMALYNRLLKLLSCFEVCGKDYVDACAGIEAVCFSQNQLPRAWVVVLVLPT